MTTKTGQTLGNTGGSDASQSTGSTPPMDQPRMLRSANHFLGYNIHATDGRIGHAEDLLFDDLSWIVRYLVVDTGSFLPGKQVLISPSALETPIWEERNFPVTLAKTQIQEGPQISADLPVSRQHEEALVTAYGWPAYWTGFTPPLPGLDGSGVAPISSNQQSPPAGEATQTDPHLRSVKEVRGYRVDGVDGRIGEVDDFIVETNSWTIHYLVIDTRPWWFGGRVLIAPAWCDDIDWHNRRAAIRLTREQVKKAPHYDPSKPISRDDEQRLFKYFDAYGRPQAT